MKNKIIEINNLSFAYENQVILKDINLTVEEYDFMAILGPNGGGKTTLLKLINGLLKPTRGSIKVFGKEPKKVRKHIGYVPQYLSFDKHFPVSVLEVVLMSRLKTFSLLPWYSKEDLQKAYDILEQLKIKDLAHKRFGDLSGGQQQRTLIARALIVNPKLLILDEPTASVDIKIEEDIFEILKKLSKKVTIIIVSHDVSFVSSYVNKVTCLNMCSCTHNIEELDKNTLMDIYHGTIKTIEHHCGL
jgi:zinc transport system ATP-binding protein